MPREIITSMEASRILSQEKVRAIDVQSEIAHSEIVYEILTNMNGSLVCDYCGTKAKFIQHTRDHIGQNFIALTCVSCAPRGYNELAQSK